MVRIILLYSFRMCLQARWMSSITFFLSFNLHMYMISDLQLIISILSRIDEIRHWPPIFLLFLSFFSLSLQLFSLIMNSLSGFLFLILNRPPLESEWPTKGVRVALNFMVIRCKVFYSLGCFIPTYISGCKWDGKEGVTTESFILTM